MLWKQDDFSNLHFRSKIWNFYGFGACNDEKQPHYVYIKDFERFMFHKTKNKNKQYFCKSCLQCFSSKNVLTEHKEVCLDINDAHSVRLEEWATGFKNCFKQIPVPFKVYIDFECNLESVKSYGGSYPPKISRSHSL